MITDPSEATMEDIARSRIIHQNKRSIAFNHISDANELIIEVMNENNNV